jgi:hypothetical protein
MTMRTLPRRPVPLDPADGTAALSEVVDLIRRVARDIDARWKTAVDVGGAVEAVMAMGEASQGLHRALTVLVDWSGTP